MTLPIPQEPLGNGERVHSSIVSIQLGSLWLLKELGQASCPLAAAQWYTGCNSPSWTLHSWPRSHLCPLRTSNEAEPSKQTARQHSLAWASPVGKQLERRHSSLTMLLFKKKTASKLPHKGRWRIWNILNKENTTHALKDGGLDTPTPGKHRLPEEAEIEKLEQRGYRETGFSFMSQN